MPWMRACLKGFPIRRGPGHALELALEGGVPWKGRALRRGSGLARGVPWKGACTWRGRAFRKGRALKEGVPFRRGRLLSYKHNLCLQG